MYEEFEREHMVREFADYLEKYGYQFEQAIENGLYSVHNLSFFIGEGYSNNRITEYIILDLHRRHYETSKKFKEQYLFEALDLIFEEFELYTGKDIQWVKEGLYAKLITKGYEKNWENRLYGRLVCELVKHGSSQKNSIEFVSAISGKAETIIRDSFYDANRMLKKFNECVLGGWPVPRISYFLKENRKAVLYASKQLKFAKSVAALEKVQVEYATINEKMKGAVEAAVKRIEDTYGKDAIRRIKNA